MHTQWIEQRTVQRVSLREGLVLSLDDYNELVIARPMRLTLPAIGSHPSEEVLIDPARVSAQERPLLDLAGAVCTRAWCDDEGGAAFGLLPRALHRCRSRQHETAWELYGKRHGYMACLPHGRVRVVRHDLVDDETDGAAN